MSFFCTPNKEDLQRLSGELKLNCSTEEINAFEKFFSSNADTYGTLWNSPKQVPPVRYPRTLGYRPSAEENPYNAWYWRCSVRGESNGKLKGKKVAVKDHAFVAGVPMMNGTIALEGFIPEFDATIVTRMLEEGAEIVGKSAIPYESSCESSNLNHNGAVKNPWDTSRSAGGSSTGSAVLLAIGEVDLATGGDQGGSIRIPASNCGVVGLKPTFGLVPYTGVCPLETTLDHVGPMARTVEECALMLEVIAGYDNDADSRQPSCGFSVPQYTVEMKKPPNALKIGIMKEGFESCESNVQECVRKAVDTIRNCNQFAAVDEVSIPAHLYALPLYSMHLYAQKACTAGEKLGVCAQLLEGDGSSHGAYGLHSSRFTEAMQCGLKKDERDISPMDKWMHLWYKHYTGRYGHATYARGQSELLDIRRKYDKALREYDVLIMPTLPQIPAKLSENDIPLFEAMFHSCRKVSNTAPFDSTHHPALTLNAGFVEGLPVGMQIVGRRWDDATVLRAAYHIEQMLKPLQTETIKRLRNKSGT